MRPVALGRKNWLHIGSPQAGQKVAADILSVAGGTPQSVQGMQPGEQVFGIGSDNRTLFVGRVGELPLKVYRLNAASGERQLWKEIGPADRTGTDNLGNFRVLQDGNAYFYSYFRSLSELYVFRSLK
jgi:hypothetical protein